MTLSTVAIALSAQDPTRFKTVSEGRRRWLRFYANKLAFFSAIFCLLLVLAAILAPVISPYAYNQVDYSNIFAPPGTAGHLLGTDNLGRDVLSRLLFSLRTALTIAFSAEIAALVFALLIGLAAGYLGGRIDQLLMAGTDIMFAFPSYLFAVILVTVLGRSDGAVILAIAVGSWVSQARLIRAQVMKMKVQEFVEAGQSMGASSPTLVLRYILPGAWGPMLVATSFGIPAAIMAESGLALLGLGVAPPTPSWGTMIIEGYGQLFNAPYLILAPLILFALTMLAFTWVGDGLRDAFDVSSDGRA